MTEIERIRKKVGMSAKKFGLVIGRSVSAVYDYEKGQRKIPPYIIMNAAKFEAEFDKFVKIHEKEDNK